MSNSILQVLTTLQYGEEEPLSFCMRISPVPKTNTLLDQAMHALVPYVKGAFLVLDTRGRIQFLNEKAEKITGKSKEELLGKPFKSITKEKIEYEPKIAEQVRATIETPQGGIPAEIVFRPLQNENCSGTLVTLTVKQPEKFHILGVGGHIQKLFTTESIYKILGEELTNHGVTFMVLPFRNNSFSVGYNTLDPEKIEKAESAAGICLSDITFQARPVYAKKIQNKRYFFFSDILSFVDTESITPQGRTVFSLVAKTPGVAVTATVEGTPAGVIAFLSEEFQPEDAPVLSVLGAQVSAALERAAHFEQLDTDLNVLKTQIDTRTKELEKVKSQMESIVHSSVDAIIATDMDGYITFVNKGVETMFGYQKEEIVGQPITRYYAGGRKEAKRHKVTILKKELFENEEFDFLAKDGRKIHTLASLSLLKNRKGRVTGVMAMLKDITEQKRLQQTLELLNKAAFRIQKSRTQKEIFTVTGEELKQLDFHVVFMALSDDKTTGKVVYMTPGKAQDMLEAQGILSIIHEFPLDYMVYKELVEKKEVFYIDDFKNVVKKSLPSKMHEIAEKGIDIIGIADKKAIIAPLVIHGETAGLLVVISENIARGDMPFIQAFTNQVSTALENAKLLKESQTRADELAENLEEQQLLRELNTKLFLAQSLDEALDAAIEGIHKLGKTFSNIKILTEDRAYAAVVRLEMEPKLLKAVKKIVKKMKGVTLEGYKVSLKDTIYDQFFKNQTPLITPNIDVGDYPALRADLTDMYAGIAPKNPGFHHIITRFTRSLPYESVMVFPLLVGGQTMGALTVASKKVFSRRDFELMRTRAEMVSSAVERIKHSEKVVETFQELRAVQRINALLNMGASLDSILIQIASNIKEVYHYEFAYPLLLDPSKKYLTFTHMPVRPAIAEKISKAFGVDLKDFLYPIAEDTSLFTTVIKEKKFLIRKGLKEMADEIPFDKFRSAVKILALSITKELGLDNEENNVMIAPLPCGDEVIGILLLGHRKELTQKDFQHLKYFLDQVGIAIAKSEGERRLRQSLEELQELDQMKSEFIDVASHELRTPLTTLKLYLEMIALDQYGRLSEPLQERITIMQESVNRLEEIIDQTLVASKLLKNKLSLEEEKVSLLEIARDAVELLQPLWKVKNQRICVERVDLPYVEGDEKTLFTVVRSLVDNAVRYSPEGTEIVIRFAEHSDVVECMVEDQGCGIPLEHHKKIFEEFYIVPSETEYARMDGRTGLGLFIAKGIVEQHKGRIWVESTPGKGSTFHFTVPKGSS